MKLKDKIAKKNDNNVMKHFRHTKANPLGWNDKLKCSCGNSIPDNRYHGKCQNCYFIENDVTLQA